MNARALSLVAALLGLPPGSLLGQDVTPPTPNEADIPHPSSGAIGLAGADRPDITRFLNVRTASSPSLSPDGTRLAFRTSTTGRPQLWVVGSQGGWPVQLTFGESVTFHEWSPSGEWIAYGSDRGGNEREGFYLIAPDGTLEQELLAPSEAFRVFGGFSPDGRQIAYATTEDDGVDFDIHVLDIETGEDRKILDGRMGLYVASWRPDGEALLVSEVRGEDANDVYMLDLVTGELDTLLQPEIASSYGGFAWHPDESGFFVATDQDSDVASLAFFDVRLRRLALVEQPESEVDAVALSHDGQLLTWTVNRGGYSVLQVTDTETGTRVDGPELPVGIYRVSWAKEAPTAAITISGPQIPGDIWTWNVSSGSVTRATWSSSAGLDLSAMVVPTHHDFRARDGETLHGLLYRPHGLEAGSRPPVLLAVHGGPTGQARPRFNAVHQYLLARGIAIFDLNFRGSTGYGKRFARLDNGRLRPNQVYDMADALEWLDRGGHADAARAAVMGGSYGGYMTLAALTMLPQSFRSGVAFVGVSNWITALEGASPQLKASDRVEYGDIDDPEDREFFRQISPIAHVANVRAPVMVVHGANDPRDPVSESDQFVRAVRERGGEVEYLRFPDEGHGIRKLTNRITAYRRVAAFLERTLGMESAGEAPIP